VDCQAEENAWRASLPGDWEQLLATLSKPRRNRTRTLLRRTIDDGRVTLHQVTSAEELERGFEVFVDLHQRRRQSLSQPGCFASKRFNDFHREMAARWLELGRLRLLWTELEGRPLSAEYGFTGGSSIYYYQTGFEPELADESPGTLALAVSLRRAV